MTTDRDRRVVVTGMGVVCALGNDVVDFWAKLRAGEHGFGSISLDKAAGSTEPVEPGTLQFKMGARATEYAPSEHFDRKQLDVMDRFAQLLLVAARQAIADAGLHEPELSSSALVTATSLAGQSTQDELFESLYKKGRRRLTPFAVPKIMANSGASQLSMEAGICGPTFTVSTACSSSNHAIGLGYWLVQRGMVERAIVGGSDAPFSLGHLKAWDALRVVSPNVCRPFSTSRDGLTLGEGAGVLVLETLDVAKRRDAKIRAELSGFGMSADASHITRPATAGALLAMRSALEDAELEAEQVDYVNAHGTGTLMNDEIEASALAELFQGGNLPLVSSTKSMHGHALGASGALEAAASVRAIETGLVPPTAGFDEPDPGVRFDFVPNTGREATLRHVLSNSFAFGGLNASLVFSRFPS